MPKYRHISGRELTAQEGTKRHRIFERTQQWQRIEDEPQPASQAQSEPVHIGGGWYRVPGQSEPVQGKEAANKAAHKEME